MSHRRITREQANNNEKLKKEIEDFNPFVSRDSEKAHCSNSSIISVDETLAISGSFAHSTIIGKTNSGIEGLEDLDKTIKEQPKLQELSVPSSNKPVIMALNMVSIKDALKVVHEFDGQNIPMSEFFLGCDEAREMIGPENEAALAKFLRSKIKGEALISLQGQSFRTIEDLKDHLKSMYVPKKSVLQLQGELGNEYQQDGETVLKFANRIREIGQRILDAQKSAAGAVDVAFRRATEQSIIECFKRGLQPEILRNVTDADDLSNFVKNAIKAEAVIEDQKALRRQNRDKLEFTKPNRKQTYTCQKCNSEEHSTVNCLQGPSCQICKGTGHTAELLF